MKQKLKRYIIVLIAFVMMIFLDSCIRTVYANENIENQMSKKYQEWINLPEEKRENTIPPLPVNIRLEKKNKSGLVNILSLVTNQIPAKYDIRDNTDINIEVKNQLQEGACWIFSANTTLELNLALNGESANFSEKHSEYDMSNTFFDDDNPNSLNRTAGDGATSLGAFTYYARGTGPVLEEYMPFDNSHDLMDYYDLPKNVAAKKVDGMYYFPGIYKKYKNGKVICVDANDEPLSDTEVQEIRNEIKEHIMKYGAVSSSVYAANDELYYNEETFACNVNRSDIYANHAVTIVGWDDNYSKDNFKTKPSKDGAYIILNSWGTEFGDQGYYYVSYEDFLIENVLRGVESVKDVDYDNIYQYDTNDVFWEVSNKYCANLFTATDDENLTEIKLGDMTSKTCNIYVKTGTDNLNIKNLTPVAKNIKLKSGYTTVKLDNSIKLTKNSKFAVIVEVIEDDVDGIGIESNYMIPMNNVISHENESFVSDDGENWEDLYDPEDFVNLSIKAFTQKDTKTLKISAIESYLDEQITGSLHINLNASYVDNGKTVGIRIKKGGTDVTNKFAITQNKIVGNGAFITLTQNTNLSAGEYQVTVQVEGYSDQIVTFEVSNDSENIITVQFHDQTFYEYVKKLIFRAEFDDENMRVTARKANFDKVKVINVQNKPVTDVRGIENFTNLNAVDVSGTRITNYEFLDLLNPNLEVLGLGNVSGNVLNQTSRFTKLKKLAIYNNSNLQNLDFLGSFSNLEELWLRNCTYSDFSKIGELTTLKKLDFLGTTLEDTEFLKTLINVEELYFIDCNITNYDFLQYMNSLEKIYMSGNPVTDEDLVNLNKLKNLKLLSASSENLNSLNFLKNTDLEVLYLNNRNEKNDKVTDFSVIGELKNLKELSLSGFRNIESIDFLKNCNQLQSLIILDGKVNDASVLDSDIFKDTIWETLTPAVMRQNILSDIYVGGIDKQEIILKVPPIIEQACDDESILYAFEQIQLTHCEWNEKGKSIKVSLKDVEDFAVTVNDGKACSDMWYGVIFYEPGIEFSMINNQRYITILDATNNSYENVITSENFPLATTYKVKDINGNDLNTNSKLGTGTTITIFDEENEELKSYIVSILGDLDGNGDIDLYDILRLIELVMDADENYEWPDYLKLAGNCDKQDGEDIEKPNIDDIARLVKFYFENIKW